VIPPGADRLRDPNAGDPVSAEQTRIQNELLRRFVKLPNSITNSSGTRMVVRRAERRYRRFTLTETLNAGSYAAVTWPDDSAGTVYDYDTCCWGLTGEQGEAYLTGDTDGNGIQWVVCKNPGQGCYYGTLKDDATSSPCNVLITIASVELTLSCVMRRPPDVGEKYAAGTGVYAGHFRGSWEIVSILECAVPV
jgi:hypothetical protein